jgi:hypothetical protein
MPTGSAAATDTAPSDVDSGLAIGLGPWMPGQDGREIADLLLASERVGAITARHAARPQRHAL